MTAIENELVLIPDQVDIQPTGIRYRVTFDAVSRVAAAAAQLNGDPLCNKHGGTGGLRTLGVSENHVSSQMLTPKAVPFTSNTSGRLSGVKYLCSSNTS